MIRVYVRFHPRDGDLRAAEAARSSFRSLCRQKRVSVPHRMLPGHESSPLAALQEVLLGAARQIFLPCAFESLSCEFETGRGLPDLAARPVRSRVEADRPVPLIDLTRNPGTLTNRSDMNIAIENVPGFLMDPLHAAAGEGWRHASYLWTRLTNPRL